MGDLAKNGVHGRLLNDISTTCNSQMQIKTQFGISKTVDVGETVRQGSVLEALMSANSMDEMASSAKDTRIIRMRSIEIVPIIFQDNIAALTNSRVESIKKIKQ